MLDKGLQQLRQDLLNRGYKVKTESWQGKQNDQIMLEVLHANIKEKMFNCKKEASDKLKATQPWADIHFKERVGGKPLNPPPSHVMWLKDTDKYLSGESFSHSYPERLWQDREIMGIRFHIANLSTAVDLLKKEPYTRQCYIPIWFPEDGTAAVQGERVPCTFGWHFMLRSGQLHCAYHMRSCDVVRHLHNDLYFANCLCLWLIKEADLDAKPGVMHFSSSSLHCFNVDKYTLEQLCADS